MKVTVAQYLNIRTGKPSTSAPNPGYKDPGQPLVIEKIVVGEEYNGSAIWYCADDKNFYWSGGVNEAVFEFPSLKLDSFNTTDQQVILKEICHYYKRRFSETVVNFIDLSVRCLNDGNGKIVCGLDLSVTQNQDSVPTRAIFKGFNIPLQIVIDTCKGNPKAQEFKLLTLREQRRILSEAKKSLLNTWTQFSGIQSVKVGYKNNDTSKPLCLVFQVVEKDKTIVAGKIPPYMQYDSSDGRHFELPTDIESVGPSITHAICEGQGPKKPGCSIGRDKMKETGTIGLKVKRNVGGSAEYYVLSCYHVLCSPELNAGIIDFKKTTPSNTTIISPSVVDGNGIAIGNVVDGFIDDWMDVAIAKLDNPNIILESIADMNDAPLDIASVSEDDENVTRVKLSGRTSGLTNGKIVEAWTFVSPTYTVIGKKNIYGVIMTTKMSSQGDSGACVLDLYNGVIGLLIASNNKYSYVVPIERILNHPTLTLQICYP